MADNLIFDAFDSISIPKNQTILYLDLLKNPKSSATKIAKRAKMHRANVYDTLTRLIEKNLVYTTIQDGTKLFSALSTSIIIDREKERIEKLNTAMKYIDSTYISGNNPEVYTLEGLNAVKSLLFNLIEQNSDIWIYGLAENEGISEILNNSLMQSFHLERIKKRIELKLLLNKMPSEELGSLHFLKYTKVKLLPKNQKSKPSKITQIVCGNIVLIILWINPISTIILENEIISEEFINLFGLLWNLSTEIPLLDEIP